MRVMAVQRYVSLLSIIAGTRIMLEQNQSRFCPSDNVMWLQLQFDFYSTGIRRAFDCLSKVIKVTVT